MLTKGMIGFSRFAVTALALSFLAVSAPASLAVESSPTPQMKQAETKDEARTDLNDMAETLKRIIKAASELKGEASHQGINPEDELDQMVMNPYPNFYAPGMNTTGTGPLLPPRKKWVDFSMDHLQRLLAVLDGEVAAVSPTAQAAAAASAAGTATDAATGAGAPAWMTSEIKAQLEVLGDAHKLLDQRYQDLQSITKGPPYSNHGIRKGTDYIKDATCGINECRKRILHLLK